MLESEFGIDLPKDLQREFGPLANDAVDRLGREVSGAELKDMFWQEFVERTTPWELHHFHADGVDGVFSCRASVRRNGQEIQLTGAGNGPIAAFVQSLINAGLPAFEVSDFKQHALSAGTAASAISYLRITRPDGTAKWGAGVDTNIELASIKAALRAVNRMG